MKKLFGLSVSALIIMIFTPAAIAQKALVKEFISANNFRQNNSNKLNTLNYLAGKSKTGDVTVFQFNNDVIADSLFELNIFRNVSLTAVQLKKTIKNKDYIIWNGRIFSGGKPAGSIVLVQMYNELSGNISFGNKNYSINPLAKGVSALYQIDYSKYPTEDAPDKKVSGNRSLNLSSSIPSCNLRVLVAFTTDAENRVKSELGYSNIQQFIQQAIAETNQGFLNSNVYYNIELAASVRVNYTESGSYDTDLERFAGIADGYMDEVHTYRNLYAADVCALIFDNNALCGKADAIQADATTAFCLVHYACAIGNYSLGHEIAHLHGCRHNTEQDGTDTPFAYGHGYVYQPGNWRTIMAYVINDETRLPYYSNPNITYNGVAMGTNSKNYNAKVLNGTVATVAAFRSTPGNLVLNSSASLDNKEAGDAQASNIITLEPGFKVTNASNFHAYIESCTDLSNTDITSAFNKAAGTLDLSESDNNLTAYPNPTSSIIHLGFSTKKYERNVTVQVFSATMQKVNEIRWRDLIKGKQNKIIDLSGQSSGLYYIVIMLQNKKLTATVSVTK